MSLLQTARDALVQIPMADVLRERLSLALDQLADAEAKIAVLQTENGRLQAQLERVRLDNENYKEQLQRLQDEHAEEVVIHRAIEWRKGKRTRNQWLPFCPACHLPLHDDNEFMECKQCGLTTASLPFV